jgi:Uma2 family endonuclease
MDDRRVITDVRSAEDGILAGEVVEREPCHAGLRMSANEYEKLPDDGFRYELIDGVVVISPSPDFEHQSVTQEVARQIGNHLVEHRVGRVVQEMDINFDVRRVYRPDLVFLSTERFPRPTRRVHAIPDMILEVLSPGTRGRDLRTKREDYERFGVTEYWIVDPNVSKFTFLRLAGGAYRSVAAKGRKFTSLAVPGFTLDIAAVKRVMRG